MRCRSQRQKNDMTSSTCWGSPRVYCGSIREHITRIRFYSLCSDSTQCKNTKQCVNSDSRMIQTKKRKNDWMGWNDGYSADEQNIWLVDWKNIGLIVHLLSYYRRYILFLPIPRAEFPMTVSWRLFPKMASSHLGHEKHEIWRRYLAGRNYCLVWTTQCLNISIMCVLFLQKSVHQNYETISIIRNISRILFENRSHSSLRCSKSLIFI